MQVQGTVFKYGDNVDTDVIIPARYLNTSDPAELAKHCMEDLDKDFVKMCSRGYHCGGQELRLRLFPGTCSLGYQNSRCFGGDRRHLRPDLLPECDQHWASDP